MPKQHSSGGKDRLGSISKQGDRYLRSLFTAGALARELTFASRPLGPFVTLHSSHIVALRALASFWDKRRQCVIGARPYLFPLSR